MTVGFSPVSPPVSVLFRGGFIRVVGFVAFRDLFQTDELLAGIKVDQAHPLGRPAGFADFRYTCTDQDATGGHQHQLVTVCDQRHGHQCTIAFAGIDGNHPLGAAT